MPALNVAQLSRFAEEGYLVVEGVLDPVTHIQPLMDEYALVLDAVAGSFLAQGLLRSSYGDLPFRERLIEIVAESGRSLSQHFDISLPQTGVRADTPIHTGPAVFNLLTEARLLDVVQSVVGPEIYSNPVQHIRMKLPRRVLTSASSDGLNAKIPWHQDNGVVLPEADESSILTVWIPLTDATIENGCLQVIPRSHLGALAAHCPSARGAAIPEALIAEQDAVPLEMRAGSLLLMHQRTIHSSLENTTDDQVRISFDLRYQPVGQPTGRPAFPGFVARSAAHPETVLRDAHAWAQSWMRARAALAEHENPVFNRWQAGIGVCA